MYAKAIPVFEYPDTTIQSNPDTLQVVEEEIVDQPIKAPVYFNAEDSIKADWKTGKIYLYGNAVATYDGSEIRANYIEYDMENSMAMATSTLDSLGNPKGKPVLKDGNDESTADSLWFNFKTKKGLIKQVRMQVSEGFIDGNMVLLDDDKTVYIKDGRFCPCEDPDAHTKFRVTKIKVMEDLIVTGPGYLEMAGIPTPIAFPFGFFPNKKERTSGIIIPTYGESATQGFFLQDGGYYLPIGEKVDMQFLGDIYTRGSWALKNITRYNVRYKYKGDFNLSYSVFKNSEPEFPDYSVDKNFWVRWNHQQSNKANPKHRFSARINAGTSNNFKNNLNTTTPEYLSNQFNSNIQYTRIFPGKPFTFSVNASHSQNSNTGAVNVTLPAASFGLNRITPLSKLGANKAGKQWYDKIGLTKLGFNWRVDAANQISVNDTSVALNNMPYLRSQLRNGIKQTAGLNTSIKLLKGKITLTPAATYNGRAYFRTLDKSYDAVNDAIITDTITGFVYNHDYSFRAALTTKIYGYYKYKRGKLHTIRHVLTPNLSFNYRPNFDTYLNNDIDGDGDEDRYSPYQLGIYGFSPTGESGALRLNLINSIEAKMRSRDTTNEFKKVKIIENFNISGGYDIAADSFNVQNVVMSARTTLFKKLSLNFNNTIDPYHYNASGDRVNVLALKENGKIGRMTTANLATNFRFQSKKPKKQRTQEQEEDLQAQNIDPNQYLDFNIPWQASFGYNLRYNRQFFTEIDPETLDETVIDSMYFTQALNVNGNFSITDKWKFTFSSGYDFIAKGLSYTTIGVVRDLNCWEMSFTWIPIGFRKSYNVSIYLKNPLLKDLKLSRQRNWFDF